MHAIAHGGCTDTRKTVCTEGWPSEKNPLPHRGIEPASTTRQSDALTNSATSPPLHPYIRTPPVYKPEQKGSSFEGRRIWRLGQKSVLSGDADQPHSRPGRGSLCWGHDAFSGAAACQAVATRSYSGLETQPQTFQRCFFFLPPPPSHSERQCSGHNRSRACLSLRGMSSPFLSDRNPHWIRSNLTAKRYFFLSRQPWCNPLWLTGLKPPTK